MPSRAHVSADVSKAMKWESVYAHVMGVAALQNRPTSYMHLFFLQFHEQNILYLIVSIYTAMG